MDGTLKTHMQVDSPTYVEGTRASLWEEHPSSLAWSYVFPALKFRQIPQSTTPDLRLGTWYLSVAWTSAHCTVPGHTTMCFCGPPFTMVLDQHFCEPQVHCDRSSDNTSTRAMQNVLVGGPCGTHHPWFWQYGFSFLS